jgi:hypothetical protein
MELLFQEIFLEKLTENEISIEKLVQTQFEFLKCPNKMPLNLHRNFSYLLRFISKLPPMVKTTAKNATTSI